MSTHPIKVTTDPAAIRLVEGVQLRKERPKSESFTARPKWQHQLPTSVRPDPDRP
jgi:hypothetical protein